MKHYNYINEFTGKLDISINLPENKLEKSVNINNWILFQPQKSIRYLFLRRTKLFLQHARSFPPVKRHYISTNKSNKNWIVYFCYTPEGRLSDAHEYTISKLKEDGFQILLVCACIDIEDSSKFSKYNVDGLILKKLRGYDFSGYTAALMYLAEQEIDYNIIVLNDSVFGPFRPIKNLFLSSPWKLTGCMSYDVVENHIISFCFGIQNFNFDVFRALRTVLTDQVSFDSQGPVSLLQETRLAAKALETMSVGSIVGPPTSLNAHNYLMGNPKGLLDIGFPFIKKSIFGRRAHLFDQTYYLSVLEELGHPISNR